MSSTTRNNLTQKTPVRHSQSQQYSYKKSGTNLEINSFATTTQGFLTQGSMTNGFSQNIGSSPLRHASPNYSFAKDSRFKQSQSFYNGENKLNLNSTLFQTQKVPTLGFGKKYIYPFHTMRNAGANPSPDRYFHKTDRDRQEQLAKDKKKPEFGKTFGESFAKYRSVYVPGQKQMNILLSQKLPGPGTYEVAEKIGSEKLKFSLLGPGKRQNDFIDKNPPPNQYSPRHQITEKSRFNKITFGIGARKDFTKMPQAKANPSPQKYSIPSIFDQFNKKSREERQKMIERRQFFRKNRTIKSQSQQIKGY